MKKINYQSTNREVDQKKTFLVPVSTTNLESGHNFDFFLFSNKLINLLMLDGKKLKASTIFFEMLSHLKREIEGKKEKSDISILQLVFQALENVKPSLEVRKVRVAGSTYLVPCVLSKKRQETLALRWIIESARKKKKNSKYSLSECLADELLNASKKQGQARQKRDELHRLAEANRAYIRYRWW